MTDPLTDEPSPMTTNTRPPIGPKPTFTLEPFMLEVSRALNWDRPDRTTVYFNVAGTVPGVDGAVRMATVSDGRVIWWGEGDILVEPDASANAQALAMSAQILTQNGLTA